MRRVPQLERLQVADPVLQRLLDGWRATLNQHLREYYIGGSQAAQAGYNEEPAGTVNGTTGSDGNSVFTLARTPAPAASLLLYLNGALQVQGRHYTLSGNVVTYAAGRIPVTGDIHRAFYS